MRDIYDDVDAVERNVSAIDERIGRLERLVLMYFTTRLHARFGRTAAEEDAIRNDSQEFDRLWSEFKRDMEKPR